MFSKLFKKSENKKVDEAILLSKERFSFMSKEEQLQFQDEISRYFQDKYDFIIEFDHGLIKDEEGTMYGLDNVAQHYHQTDGAKGKRSVIKDHFDTILKSKKENEEILEKIDDYSKIKKYLTVRVYPSDYSSGNHEFVHYKHEIQGFNTVLTLDLPSTVFSIKKNQIKKWNIDKEELFNTGFENTFKKYPVDRSRGEVDKEVFVEILNGENLFVATQIYNLSNYKNILGEYGSLMIVPNRHTVMIFPINDHKVLQAMSKLGLIATKMFEEGPGSITPNLYWYQDNNFTNIPYELDEKSFQLHPPREFLDVLNKIPESKS